MFPSFSVEFFSSKDMEEIFSSKEGSKLDEDTHSRVRCILSSMHDSEVRKGANCTTTKW